MDDKVKKIQKIRRARMQWLLDEKFDGVKVRFSRALQRSDTYVNGRLDGTKPIGEQLARHIERCLDLKDYWMDELPVQVGREHLPERSAMGKVRAGNVQWRALPVLSAEQAGRAREAVQAYKRTTRGYDEMIPDKQHGPWAFFLIMVGDSMEPLLHNGDRVVVDPDVQPKPGQLVCAKCNGQKESTVKKYLPMTDDIFELQPVNPNYGSIFSDRVACRVQGTVVEQHTYLQR